MRVARQLARAFEIEMRAACSTYAFVWGKCANAQERAPHTISCNPRASDTLSLSYLALLARLALAGLHFEQPVAERWHLPHQNLAVAGSR